MAVIFLMSDIMIALVKIVKKVLEYSENILYSDKLRVIINMRRGKSLLSNPNPTKY